MKMRQSQCLVSAESNPNETWMKQKLKTTKYKWNRQARWGWNLFDFWCHFLGTAVEVDGIEHDREMDLKKDRELFKRSGILVLRVKNKCENDANYILSIISDLGNWSVRRKMLGLNPIKGIE